MHERAQLVLALSIVGLPLFAEEATLVSHPTLPSPANLLGGGLPARASMLRRGERRGGSCSQMLVREPMVSFTSCVGLAFLSVGLPAILSLSIANSCSNSADFAWESRSSGPSSLGRSGSWCAPL